jgi:hypothetical protein
MKKEVYEKITKKKELSQLPKQDIEAAYRKFEKRQVSEVEKIRLTRDLLNQVFWPFRSHKLLGLKNKDKDPEWILRKHMATRERLEYYEEVYKRLLKKGDCVFDLGSGANGFSYKFMPKDVYYIGIEAVGQLVKLMNYYFKTRGLKGMAVHESLFELEKIKKYIKQVEGNKVVFLFKVLDSLEMLEKDYSKKLLLEITPLVDRVVVSFATKSMIKKEKFKVTRKWIIDFIKENFNIVDDFEIGNERYIIFNKK